MIATGNSLHGAFHDRTRLTGRLSWFTRERGTYGIRRQRRIPYGDGAEVPQRQGIPAQERREARHFPGFCPVWRVIRS